MRKTWMRVLCVALCMSVLLGAGGTAFAESGGKTGEISWKVDNKGTLTITGKGKIEQPISDATVRKIVISKGITGIGDNTFLDCTKVTAVTIPDSVTSIGNGAFSGCKALKSITIPNSVTEIVGNPFAGCEKLTRIRVSAKHPYLEVKKGVLFSKPDRKLICYPCGLTAANYAIPKGTAIIGEEAFHKAKAKSITLPDSVISLESGAFYGCSVKSITIPDSVTKTGGNPFMGCAKLTDIRVSAKHPCLEVKNGVLFSKPDKRLICYPCAFDTEKYAIPKGTESIGDYAFADCHKMQSVTVPEGVTGIGQAAFAYCWSLEFITIPEGMTSIGQAAFAYCGSLESITIPNGVTSIGTGAFSVCDKLKSVTIPKSVTSIGESAFNLCTHLESIDIPASVKSIGKKAYDNCPSLTVSCPKGSCAEEYCRENKIKYKTK